MLMEMERYHIKIFRLRLGEKFTQQRVCTSDKTKAINFQLQPSPRVEWPPRQLALPVKTVKRTASIPAAGRKL
jgi:hypothetical protein